MPQDDKPSLAKSQAGPKPGNVLVKYIGQKDNFINFKRPKLKSSIVFKDKIAEVSSALGQALTDRYPKTFKCLSEPVVKPAVAPEV